MNVKQEIDHRLENIKGDFENLSQDLRKGGRQVWLASLGAVSLVDEQGRALNALVAHDQEEREDLDGLPEAHVVGEAAAEFQAPEEV